MRCTAHNHGFTLLEVLLYLGVAAGITIAMLGLLMLIERSRVQRDSAGDILWSAAWTEEQIRALLPRGPIPPEPGVSSSSLPFRDGSRLMFRDGSLLFATASSSSVFTAPDVDVRAGEFTGVASGSTAFRLHLSLGARASGATQFDDVFTFDYTFYDR